MPICEIDDLIMTLDYDDEIGFIWVCANGHILKWEEVDEYGNKVVL